MCTKAIQQSLTLAKLIQSILPHHISLRTILTLSFYHISYQHFILHSGPFLYDFSPITYMDSSLLHSGYMPCHSPSFN